MVNITPNDAANHIFTSPTFANRGNIILITIPAKESLDKSKKNLLSSFVPSSHFNIVWHTNIKERKRKHKLFKEIPRSVGCHHPTVTKSTG